MNFKLGDTVRVIKNHICGLKIGDVGRLVKHYHTQKILFRCQHNNLILFDVNNNPDYFELVKVEKIGEKSMKFQVGDKVKKIMTSKKLYDSKNILQEYFVGIGRSKDKIGVIKDSIKGPDFFDIQFDNEELFSFEKNSIWEDFFEKIEDESMKFEDVLSAYRDGAEIEWFCDRDNRWIDMPRPGQTMEFSIGFLMNGSFRIKPKKEKVKRYQVLYLGNDGLYRTTFDLYKDKEDFEKNFSFGYIEFDSLILKSEKEYE